MCHSHPRAAGAAVAGTWPLQPQQQGKEVEDVPWEPGLGPSLPRPVTKHFSVTLPVPVMLRLVGASVPINYTLVLLRYPWQDLGSRLLRCCS